MIKDTPPQNPSSYVHVIEGTEFERGWGSRPDGFVAFLSEAAAMKFIEDYERVFNAGTVAPNEYTIYSYVGLKSCSATFFEILSKEQHNVSHFRRMGELRK